MYEFTFELLSLFSLIVYMSTALFFWAIFKENCSAYNNSLGKNNTKNVFGRSPYPGNPNFREYLRLNWMPLTLSGLMILGVFGFLITHVCDYT
jgi:hypothetical protein